MPHASTPVTAASSAPWRELAVLLVLATLGTTLFWFTDLDLRAARYFYHPDLPGDGWPVADAPLWRFFYRYAGAITATLALGGLALLVAGSLVQRWRRWRVHGLFAVLLVLLGPGLMVNAVFKDHWGRPRPHQVEQLGGPLAYLPPFALGEAGKAKSFPCGHCSVGFSFAALWLVLRRHHRRAAWAALAGGIVLGVLMGVGRMAAGAHWLSDVVWAALIPWLVAWVLYYQLLKMHRQTDGLAPRELSPRRRLAHNLGYGALALAILAGAALATPLHKDLSYVLEAARPFSLEADRAEVILRLDPQAAAALTLEAHVRGFGLPGNKVDVQASETASGVAYRLAHQGTYTDINTQIVLTLRPTPGQSLAVRLGQGDVRVEAPAGLPPALELDIKTGNGQVSWPAPGK